MQVLRCRKKRRRSSKRWARPSACSQTQRRNPATTAVRIWRMTAWTWEVSAWEYWGVGVFPDTGDTSIMYLGLRLWIFLKLLLWNYQWFCWFSVIFLLPDFDANNIFKAFFGGPGGFSFEGIYMNVCFYKNHSDCERLLLMSPVCLSVCLCVCSIRTRKFLLPVWLNAGFTFTKLLQQRQPPPVPRPTIRI